MGQHYQWPVAADLDVHFSTPCCLGMKAVLPSLVTEQPCVCISSIGPGKGVVQGTAGVGSRQDSVDFSGTPGIIDL